MSSQAEAAFQKQCRRRQLRCVRVATTMETEGTLRTENPHSARCCDAGWSPGRRTAGNSIPSGSCVCQDTCFVFRVTRPDLSRPKSKFENDYETHQIHQPIRLQRREQFFRAIQYTETNVYADDYRI